MADGDIFHEVGSHYATQNRAKMIEYAVAAAGSAALGVAIWYQKGIITKIEISDRFPSGKITEYPHGE